MLKSLLLRLFPVPLRAFVHWPLFGHVISVLPIIVMSPLSLTVVRGVKLRTSCASAGAAAGSTAASANPSRNETRRRRITCPPPGAAAADRRRAARAGAGQ